MPQITKIVDLTRSYVVTDPNSFPQNMMFTKQEDAPEESLPVLAFDGYNFLPTPYGYRSYFGTNATLDIQALPSRCDLVLLYQFANYQNILVALCEDGIWVSRPSTSGNTWTHSITLSVPAVGSYLYWTYATIENKLYMYRQGGANVFSILPTGITAEVVTVNTLTPSFITMAGQMGIFRANGRLGFWDSANSVSWSSLFDMMDLTPSLETLAGNSIFNSVVGRIVTILPQGDGFVIYSTKGIVGVRYSSVANILWDASSITDSAGVIYPIQVTRGLTELEHFAFTSSGIKRVGSYNALNKSHTYEEVLTDVYDFLKESRTPVKLSIINGRYLCFQVTDASYIDGKTLFTYNTIDNVPVRVLINDGTWDGVNVLPEFIAGQSVQSHIAGQLNSAVYEGMYLQWNGTGSVMYSAKVDSAIKPYNLDSFSTHVPNASIDLADTLDPYTDASFVTSLTEVVPDNAAYPFALGLGWTYPGLGNVGSAFKGIVDGYLNELIATQISEWNNFTTVQTANKAALEAIPSSTGATVQGTTPYLSSTLAQAQIDILVAAGGGTGNSYFTETDVGSMLSGAGTTAAAILSGVGTNAATYSLTRTFLGGWDVKKRTTRTYSIRSVPTPAPYNLRWSESYQQPALLLYFVPLPWASMPVQPQGGDPAQTAGYSYGVDATAAKAQLLALCPSTIDNPLNLNYYYNTPIINSNSIEYTRYIRAGGIPTGQVIAFTVSGTNLLTTLYEYFIDYVEVISIPPLTANPTITLDSTLTAFQENLTWAYFPLGTPTGNYTSGYGAFSIPGTSLAGASLGPLDVGVTYPGATFLMQDGAVAPIYPSYAGALVLDLGLKKWGKMKATYRALLDYQPINDSSQSVTYTNFGMDIGMLNAAGAIKLFDSHPADSWIRYGKLGYYRLGMTQLHEVKVHFRNSSSGTVELESSFDGRALELVQKQIHYYSSVANTTVYSDQVGRWHTIKITGNYDLTYLEVRGTVAGRR